MPDYFKGSPGDPNWYPTDTPEKTQLLEKFKVEKAFTPKNLPMVIQSAADTKSRWPSVQAWGVFGLCWGGKVGRLINFIGIVIVLLIDTWLFSWQHKHLVPGVRSKSLAKLIPRK